MRSEKLLNIEFFITEKEEGKIECKLGPVIFIICREGKNIYCYENLQRILLVLVVNVGGRKCRPLGSEKG